MNLLVALIANGNYNLETNNISILSYWFYWLMALYTASDAVNLSPLKRWDEPGSQRVCSAIRQDLKYLSRKSAMLQWTTDAFNDNPNDINGLAVKIKEGLEISLANNRADCRLCKKRIAQYNVNTIKTSI